MSTSTRFAVGVHLLALLAANGGRRIRSEDVATSANTNAAVVRRLFSRLIAAGLVRARLGHGGGFELARPADQIDLLEIFRLLEEAELFSTHRSPPNKDCPTGAHILPILSAVTDRALNALERELASTTIADIARAVEARTAPNDHASPPPAT